MRVPLKLAVLCLATALTSPAWAQDNMERLQKMQRTDAQFTYVEQSGNRAEALRAILPHIKVPSGFEVSLYAVVPDARSLAVAPQGTVVLVGPRNDKVW